MANQDTARLAILVYSDNATVRHEVIEGVGTRPDADLPPVDWTETATAQGVRLAIKDRQDAGQQPFDLLVLDAETRKLGGMGLAHELYTEMEARPPVVLLTARPQDDWLAAWARVEAVVPRPLDTLALAGSVVRVLRESGAVAPGA